MRNSCVRCGRSWIHHYSDNPLGHLQSSRSDDIAQTAILMASAHSDLITGQVLAVDGGPLTGYGEDLRGVL